MNREDLANKYFEQLPFTPYPVQEEALLAWYTSENGVLVCAPTGTGKTLIAEAALYEALHTGKRAYYTTPLIALTEQKLQEMRAAAERWGFSPEHVGLVTGNRRVNADAPILVVVAEILFNRLLHTDQFPFDDVSAVVMDEFHSFNDPERGIVWEFSLGLLPPHVRLLLLSATVGNAQEFVNWLKFHHHRPMELVQSNERKVPLTFQWVGDALLNEHLEEMAEGRHTEYRRTPALVFCFNRDECWTVAEQLKGKKMISPDQQKEISRRLDEFDWSQGAGPKLKQILLRGVGVHHAGILTKYKRVIEALYNDKLLSIVVCTETLAAGINLPARSVVLPSLLKGPPNKKTLVDPSAAHQIFGRAGRPQFDSEGFVYSLAHEDDVKILRWREKYDQIPEDTKDPQLIKAKKAMKKKMPTRRTNQQYWSEAQFEKLRSAPAGKLQSRADIPWRFLVHMLQESPDIDLIRKLIRKRLMVGKQVDDAIAELDRMLLTLWTAGYVQLEPAPRIPSIASTPPNSTHLTAQAARHSGESTDPPVSYVIEKAIVQPSALRLSTFRSVNPLYGVFVANQLDIADECERIQALESMLEMPGSVARYVRVPGHDQLPPGPLAVTRLDPHLLRTGLATAEELGGTSLAEEEDIEDDGYDAWTDEPPVRILSLGDKLRRLFDQDFPHVNGLFTQPVWAAGEVLEFGGDFNRYITTRRLQKQEGIIFRHLLRLILLLGEFAQIPPPEIEQELWRSDLMSIRERLIQACHQVDPLSTDEASRIPDKELL
ncbi:MAG: DEAD/DEAH box helicase [Planctomycetota bacterium]|nr:DEAD/DEAH box helicase [Planctomycetota bacterium]